MDIYTIGYAGLETGAFVILLKMYGINALIDVRSVPYSGYMPEYNKDNLEKLMRLQNIVYRHYPQFGIKQEDRSLYTDGMLDFEKASRSEVFREALGRLTSAGGNWTFCLMCSEKDPKDCHRGIWLGHAFAKEGINMRHLTHGGAVFSQEKIDNDLFDRYHDPTPSLFEKPFSREEEIEEAYRKANREIAGKFA